MAVYTHVDPDDLAALVARYDIGTVISCKGIAEGVENSNFLLETTKERFILTLYEKRVRESDLPFFVDLQSTAGRIAILMAALPSAANAFVLACQFGISVEQNSAAVLLSTAFSVITVSALLVWLSVA